MTTTKKPTTATPMPTTEKVTLVFVDMVCAEARAGRVLCSDHRRICVFLCRVPGFRAEVIEIVPPCFVNPPFFLAQAQSWR